MSRSHGTPAEPCSKTTPPLASVILCTIKATSDDASETNSELKFRICESMRESFGVDPATGNRRGLRSLRSLVGLKIVSAHWLCRDCIDNTETIPELTVALMIRCVDRVLAAWMSREI
jgi:hypothetical protein